MVPSRSDSSSTGLTECDVHVTAVTGGLEGFWLLSSVTAVIEILTATIGLGQPALLCTQGQSKTRKRKDTSIKRSGVDEDRSNTCLRLNCGELQTVGSWVADEYIVLYESCPKLYILWECGLSCSSFLAVTVKASEGP